MKKIISFLVFYLFGLPLHAQVILLKLNLNDCAKCQLMVSSYMDSRFSEIPCFLVFPQSMQEDSTDIKALIKDKYLIENLVFNDRYYRLLNKIQGSSIAYLSKAGKIEHQISLLDFNPDFSTKTDSLYLHDDIYRTEFPVWTVLKDNKQIKYNRSIGNVKVLDSSGSLKYTVDNNVKQLSIKAIETAYPHFYDFTLKDTADRSAAIFLDPKMGGFSLYGDNGYFTVRVPYKEIVTDRKMLERMHGDSIRITHKYALAKKQRNGEVTCYPIPVNNSINGKKAYYVIDLYSMEALNDTTFLLFYYPSDWKEHKEEREYIAVFKLRNGIIEFDRQLKNTIPDIYIDALIGYSFAANFECMDYPYYIPLMSTEMMNLENGINYKFNLPNVDFKEVDSNFVKNVISNKVEDPIYNMGLFKDTARNNVYLFSVIAKELYLTVLDMNTLKVKSSISLNNKGLNVKSKTIPYSHISYNKKEDIFLIEGKNDVLRAIPVSLLIAEGVAR